MESFSQAKFWSVFNHFYSTVPITCTQTRIHRTQSLHYDKSLKRSSLWHIVTMNFTATIYHLLCEISLQPSLTRKTFRWDIARIVQISRWFIVSMRCFADISAINGKRSEQNAFFFRWLSFALLLHSIVGCGFALTSYLYWLEYFFLFYTS